MLLDHIIIKVPWQTLLEPPESLTRNFILTPGGRHTDGKTENKLIVFRDGSYIELIAFVEDDPKHQEGHWWGEKQPGVIDFALTTNGSAFDNHQEVQKRILNLDSSSGISYDLPVQGGRTRTDGQELRWEVTFPKGAKRGELPFFCHDLTPRALRVPVNEQSVNHPCMVSGPRQLTITLPKERLEIITELYASILGVENVTRANGHASFEFGTVNELHDFERPRIVLQSIQPTPKIVDEQGVLLGNLALDGPGGVLDWKD